MAHRLADTYKTRQGVLPQPLGRCRAGDQGGGVVSLRHQDRHDQQARGLKLDTTEEKLKNNTQRKYPSFFFPLSGLDRARLSPHAAIDRWSSRVRLAQR